MSLSPSAPFASDRRGSALVRRACMTCAEETLHDRRGCIHCGTVPAMGALPRAEFAPRMGRPALPRRLLGPEEPKRCFKCTEVKPARLFSRNSRSRDGHASQCKACQAVYDAGKRLRA